MLAEEFLNWFLVNTIKTYVGATGFEPVTSSL